MLVSLSDPQHKAKFEKKFEALAAAGVISPQLVGKPVVGSLRKTHLRDLDEKLIKRFFDSY